MAVYCSRVRVGEPLLEEAGTPLLAVTLGGLHGSPGTEAPCLFRVLSLCWGPCPVVRWRHRHWPSTAHGGRAADGRACPSWVTTAGASRLWPCTPALGWGWPRCLGPTRSHRREGWADGLVKRGTRGCLPVAAASWRLRARGRLVCGTRAPATPATCRAAAAPRRAAAPGRRRRRSAGGGQRPVRRAARVGSASAAQAARAGHAAAPCSRVPSSSVRRWASTPAADRRPHGAGVHRAGGNAQRPGRARRRSRDAPPSRAGRCGHAPVVGAALLARPHRPV